MDIVKRLRHTEEETATVGKELVYLQVLVNPDGPEAADEIERLRGSYEDCINAVDTIINDGMTEPAKFAKIQHSGFTAYNYMIAMAEDIKDEIKKRAALKEKE